MRILFLTDALPPTPRGGLDRHLCELAELLDEQGHEVRIHAVAGEASDASSLAEEGPISGAMARRHAPVVREFSALLDELKPEVVHVHSMQGLPTALIDEAADFGARVLMTLHDFFALCARTHLHKRDGSLCEGPRGGLACGGCFARRLAPLAGVAFAMRHRAWQITLARCHHLIAPSAFVRDVFVTNGVDPEQIVVIGPAEARPQRLAQPGGDADVIRFVFAGDLRREKGADLAIAAMKDFDDGAVALDLLGGPPASPAPRQTDFEEELSRLAVGRNVRFYGRYEPPDLDRALDGAAAFLLPSRVRESFGRTAHRALQLGVPVIAADHGAPSEFVVEGTNGALFAPGSIDDLSRAMTRIVAGGLGMQARVENWPSLLCLEEHAASLLELYAGGSG